MKRTPIFKDRSFRIAIILSVLFLSTGLIFLLTGLAGYGWVLFGVLPVLLGFSIGALPSGRAAIYGALISVIIFLLALFVPGLSGLICVIMALPIIIPVVFLGYVISHLVKRYKEIKSTENVKILVLPLILYVILSPVEKFLVPESSEIIEVKTEQIFDFEPIAVYNKIKSVDTLEADKTFLMYFDLPIPTRCVLEKEGVGGIRTCYFKEGMWTNGDFGSGTIVEKITEIEPGVKLAMDVIETSVVGRDWIKFHQAIYLFEPVGLNRCKLTRITTYSSKLAPRFYWAPLEKIGILQEHDFVFRNLERDLSEK